MREDNLLALRRKSFVSTTDSNHDRAVYTNLVPGLNITGLNQLWVADITYIRLAREWVYLAVVLDAYSRRCIGWTLDRNIDARLALGALDSALMLPRFRGQFTVWDSGCFLNLLSKLMGDRYPSEECRLRVL